MEYIIASKNKDLYIRLNGRGTPETCVKGRAQKFSDVKARNIMKNLPKTLKNVQFVLVPLEEKQNPKNIKAENYIIPDNVENWVARIQAYNSLVVDAKKRKDELIAIESNVDKEISNCLHAIEMTKWKSGCDGYKEYKKMKTLLEKRRSIKDEISIVQSISSHSQNEISVDRVVDRLKTRDFTFREVEEYDNFFK